MEIIRKVKEVVKELEGEVERERAEPIPSLISAVDSGFAFVGSSLSGVLLVRHVGVGYDGEKLKVLVEEPKTGSAEVLLKASTPWELEREKWQYTLGKELEIAAKLPPPVAVDGTLLNTKAEGPIIGVAKDSTLHLFGKPFPDSILLDALLGEGEWVYGGEREGVKIAYLKTERHLLTITTREAVEKAVGIIAFNASLIKGFGYPPALAYAHLKAKLREEHTLLSPYRMIYWKNRDRIPFR